MHKKPIVQKTEKHISYLDSLRIISICAVIILHVAAQNIRQVEIGSFAWNTFNIYDSLTRWCVPIFVMISGALFLSKEQSIGKIYKKNIKKILIILVLWTFIYNFYWFLVNNSTFSPREFFINLLVRPYYLWFLYMLIGLYMIAPILKKIVDDPKTMKYSLILILVFCFFVPEIIEILALKHEYIASLIKTKIDMMGSVSPFGFAGYFILGYYLHNYALSKKSKIAVYTIGILGGIFTIIMTALASVQSGDLVTFFYENTTANVAAMSIALFVFLKAHTNNTHGKFSLLLSRCSLGVYLIHIIILEILDQIFNINSLSLNPIFSVPLISILIMTISYLISIILYKIPKIGKWIV